MCHLNIFVSVSRLRSWRHNPLMHHVQNSTSPDTVTTDFSASLTAGIQTQIAWLRIIALQAPPQALDLSVTSGK